MYSRVRSQIREPPIVYEVICRPVSDDQKGSHGRPGERDEIYVGSKDEKWSTVALAAEISPR